MPRKSAAALAVVAPITDQRPAAPADLTPAQRAEWEAIVRRMPHDWFTRENQPLLADLCRRIDRLRLLSAQLDEFEPDWLRDADGLARYDQMGRLAERESRMMVTLARCLRLTIQSRYQSTTAASKVNRAPAYGKQPWQYIS